MVIGVTGGVGSGKSTVLNFLRDGYRAQIIEEDQVARELLERAMVRLDLSARAYDRIVKVARTIADLEGTADIGAAHLAEAINYRSLDRGSWGR